MTTISKQFNASSKAAGVPRVIRFIGSDETLDRDGDVVSIDGWDVANFLKNPVVIYGHNYHDLPIGKATVIVDKRARQLIFDVKFPTIEEVSSDPSNPSEHALKIDAIYNMAKAGILNTVSVGFRGLESEPTGTGRLFKKQELMEVSIVPVPANPNAVAVLRAAGAIETVIKGVTMETKAGKKLSKESRDTLKACHKAINEAVAALAAFIGPDEEEQGEEAEKVGAPNTGEETGADVNDPQPEKSYVIDVVEKSSGVE